MPIFLLTKSKDISKTTYVSNKNKKVFDFLNVIILSQQNKISLKNGLEAYDAVHYVQRQQQCFSGFIKIAPLNLPPVNN